jgi:hypothetical protein
MEDMEKALRADFSAGVYRLGGSKSGRQYPSWRNDADASTKQGIMEDALDYHIPYDEFG